MVRALALVVVIAGCADARTIESSTEIGPMVTSYDLETSALEESAEVDLCALAAALPADDLCSLVCDPDALAARAAASGMPGGRCYQLRCELSATVAVSAGVCL